MISVITATNNPDNDFCRMIKSVLSQEEIEFELIVVFDGCKPIDLSYDKRIKVIFNEKSEGLAHALNIAIRASQAEYVARVDSRDICSPLRLKKQFESILVNGADITVCSVSFINANGSYLYTLDPPKSHDFIKKTLPRKNCFVHSSFFIRKSILEAVGLYDEDFKLAQDYDLVLRLLHFGAKFNFLPQSLITKKISASSSTVLRRREQIYYALKAQNKYFKRAKIFFIKALILQSYHCLLLLIPTVLRKCRFNKLLKRVNLVYVYGLRGFPNVQGGVEKHCQELYQRLAVLGVSFKILMRKGFVTNQKISKLGDNIRIKPLWAPRKMGFEALIHSFLAAFYCIIKRPRLVHVHNIGPGITILLLRLFGIKTVMTYHSQNYNHNKWCKVAQLTLRLGELISLVFANVIICIDKDNFIRLKSKRSNVVFIPNGVETISCSERTDSVLSEYELVAKTYILIVSRLSPEKGVLDVVEAFAADKSLNYYLVIAGNSDHRSNYSSKIFDLSAKDKRIKLLGFINSENLSLLYTNARLFILPSYAEGLSLALLEAAAYGSPLLLSGISQNRVFDLPESCYFNAGDTKQILDSMRNMLFNSVNPYDIKKIQKIVQEEFSWDLAAYKTFEEYKKLF